MNLIQQCLQKAAKDTETVIWTYNVDLQVKVLVISQWFYRGHLDAAQGGSLGSGGTEGYLQVSSISLRTFYLHL